MLRDANVLITGASAGIGHACAEAFARAGARLLLCARREDRLRDLALALTTAYGTEAEVLALDVRDGEAVEEALARLPEQWADIDVLVNNAGLGLGSEPLWKGSPSEWDSMIDTNVKGLLRVTRAVVPGMVGRGRGHVVNIGSIAGHEAYPKGVVYCGTKAAVARITQGLRAELLGTGVRVSAVDPGMVDTEFSTVRLHGDKKRAEAVYAGMTPLTGEDVADVVVWIASRPARVQVADVLLLPTDQASATLVARHPESAR